MALVCTYFFQIKLNALISQGHKNTFQTIKVVYWYSSTTTCMNANEAKLSFGCYTRLQIDKKINACTYQSAWTHADVHLCRLCKFAVAQSYQKGFL